MKRRSLLIVTLFTLLCTGLLLTYAGWFSGNRAGRPGTHRPDPRSHARATDPMTSEAAWRYLRCQPVHWRAMMLQH